MRVWTSGKDWRVASVSSVLLFATIPHIRNKIRDSSVVGDLGRLLLELVLPFCFEGHVACKPKQATLLIKYTYLPLHLLYRFGCVTLLL